MVVGSLVGGVSGEWCPVISAGVSVVLVVLVVLIVRGMASDLLVWVCL